MNGGRTRVRPLETGERGGRRGSKSELTKGGQALKHTQRKKKGLSDFDRVRSTRDNEEHLRDGPEVEGGEKEGDLGRRKKERWVQRRGWKSFSSKKNEWRGEKKENRRKTEECKKKKKKKGRKRNVPAVGKGK